MTGILGWTVGDMEERTMNLRTMNDALHPTADVRNTIC